MKEAGKFIGTWRLLTFEEQQPNGELTYPYGQNPLGMLIYDSNGNMSVQIMSQERQPLPASDYSLIDAETIKAAVAGFTAFFGKYEVDEERQVIVHHVEGHVLPSSVGKDLLRVYEFSDDHLILKPAANRRVIWQRVV